ncbi:uncharacterized protein IL334_001321 [Kwoniella shivajii]|uniref:Uncharacterized protein n=1 Tax=Kwoniella shivajii TaxID=564305 RepID=A0ABZ1CRK7_9TREE|nr:hypothetical protein IL334_001321 [Kwoniella shivajii]
MTDRNNPIDLHNLRRDGTARPPGAQTDDRQSRTNAQSESDGNRSQFWIDRHPSAAAAGTLVLGAGFGLAISRIYHDRDIQRGQSEECKERYSHSFDGFTAKGSTSPDTENLHQRTAASAIGVNNDHNLRDGDSLVQESLSGRTGQEVYVDQTRPENEAGRDGTLGGTAPRSASTFRG